MKYTSSSFKAGHPAMVSPMSLMGIKRVLTRSEKYSFFIVLYATAVAWIFKASLGDGSSLEASSLATISKINKSSSGVHRWIGQYSSGSMIRAKKKTYRDFDSASLVARNVDGTRIECKSPQFKQIIAYMLNVQD